MTEQNERQEMINGVRAMLNFLESNPDVPIPFNMNTHYIYGLQTRDDAARFIRIAGNVEKKVTENGLYHLIKKFGPISLNVVFWRNALCERVVVATEEVPETIVPERVIAAHTKEIVEWKCDPILDTEAETIAA